MGLLGVRDGEGNSFGKKRDKRALPTYVEKSKLNIGQP